MSTDLPALRALPGRTLGDLARALRSGAIAGASTSFGLRSAVPELDEAGAAELGRLLADGLRPKHAAILLEQVATGAQPSLEAVELVTSGPDATGSTRDTGVVLRGLFASAEERALVIGFAVHQGREIFDALARRMEERPKLAVRLCIDVSRHAGDTSTEAAILARFARRFIAQEWPGTRVPDLYFDPRSLRPGPTERSSLHAKCVAIDHRIGLVTSANLTRAAQQRNIEIGVLLRSRLFVEQLERHVEGLIGAGHLRRLVLPAR